MLLESLSRVDENPPGPSQLPQIMYDEVAPPFHSNSIFFLFFSFPFPPSLFLHLQHRLCRLSTILLPLRSWLRSECGIPFYFWPMADANLMTNEPRQNYSLEQYEMHERRICVCVIVGVDKVRRRYNEKRETDNVLMEPSWITNE